MAPLPPDSKLPSNPKPTEYKDGLCGICPAGCWVRIGMHEGEIVEVTPLPDHPLGMICTIGSHSPQVIYDPDRLRYPQRRVGKKGSGKFERISWDEAFAEIVSRLQQIKADHGAEATAIYTGRGSFDMALCDVFQPAGVAVSSASSVLFPFGSPNSLGVGALCYVSFAMIAPHTTLGEMLITMDVDVEQADMIVLWGANPATDSPPLLHQQVLRANARGAEVVAIDPRRNFTAREVDADWVSLRPGTDGALALSMIHVLIEEELYDADFADNWTIGFDDLARLAQHYHPDAAAEITGVPAATIRDLARRLASARGACPIMYTGLEYSDSGVQAIRAVLTLWALAGQLDVPGGLVIRMKENVFPQNRSGLQANPQPELALGLDRFPVYSMYRGESHAISLPQSVLEGEPYAIRALLILGGSIVTSWPQPDLWRKTLEKLDFLVTIDRHLTADSAYADIVLPATTQYEITSFMRYGPLFKIRERMIDPVGESRSDFAILAELADRLGYGHLYPQSEEALLEHALEGTGFSLEEVRAQGGSIQLPGQMMQYRKWEKGQLREDGTPGFNTPTGKFEIASTVLAEHGYEPLPEYTEPQEGPLARPDLAQRFPLVFNSGTRTKHDFRSQHHGVASLSQYQPDPTVTMHRNDAQARGIEDGDWVWVETPRGRVRYRATLTTDIHRGAIDAQMGGGGPLGTKSWQECNANALTDLERHDPISGFPVYKTLLCEVSGDDALDGSRVLPKSEDQHGLDESMANRKPPEQLRKVYLDHNATTAVDGQIRAAMEPFLTTEGGNPSSVHTRGNHARQAVEGARRSLAKAIGCTARRTIFTGSGSEANNLALKGVLHAFRAKHQVYGHLITSAAEHPSVLRTCQALEEEGHKLTLLPVDESGLVDPEALRKAISPETVLVTIMAANNETGTLQPVKELARITHEQGALFHSDAVQALGKIPIRVEELGLDLMTVSAHKLHGPKGVGALYVARGVELAPLIHGGGQEQGKRAGTENVAGVVGFGRACELAERRLLAGDATRIAALRDQLEKSMLAAVEGAKVNGHRELRLPNTLNMTLPGIRGESLVLVLDRTGIYFSSGSACKSGNPDPSHALKAMGLSDEEAHCAVRFSLGHETTAEDIEYTLECFSKALREAALSVRFVGCR